jgi:WbqC-like protein family
VNLTKRVSIIQSAYVPWKGFFDLINRCDEYVVFDQVQFVKRHWHNRNRIKTPGGAQWITIPVLSKSRFEQPICEVEISEPWAEKHWRTIETNYRHALFFKSEGPRIKEWYEKAEKMERLSEVNRFFLNKIKDALALEVTITSDANYPAVSKKTDRLLAICKAAGATHYLSGPSAREYLEVDIFNKSGIAVEWMNYGPYSEYRQINGAFEHNVTILDALLNLGPEAISSIGSRHDLTT